MTIQKACVEGIRQTNRSFLVVLLLFGVNFLFAGIIAMLFRSVVSTTFGNSLAPLKLVHDFDFTVYIDFITKNQGKLSAVYALITWFVVLNNFLSMFFDGGIIASVQSDTERFRFQSFCASCGEYFGRFMRLFCIVVPVMLVSGFVMIFLSGFVSSALVGSGETEIQLLRGFVIAAVIFLLPMSILFLASDYARVITVVENERRMLRAFWHGLRFVLRNLFKVFTLFLLYFIFSLLFLGCWAALSTQVVVDSGLLVLGVFLIQQIIAIGRSWVRVAAISSQVALYAGSRPVVQVELPFVPEIPIEKEKEPQQIPAPAEVIEEETTRVMKTRPKRPVSKRRIVPKRTKQTIKRTMKRSKK
ncbi:MAG: hypothetical protein NTX44_06625 [Ignavibacteriales bacterium]|nr:hypothetical protein [Ignavibacteriales bacterium]